MDQNMTRAWPKYDPVDGKLPSKAISPGDFCRQKLAKLAIVISSIGETVATSKVGVGRFESYT